MDNRVFYVVLLALAGAGVSGQTHHFVGGDDGWVPEMNVTSWLNGRVFKVGDKLWFKKLSGQEDAILELRGFDEFKACDFSNPIKMYTDNVDLEEEGLRYFVSANFEHCNNGLKLPVPVKSDFDPFGPPEPVFPSPGFGPFDPVKPDLPPVNPGPDPFPVPEPPFGPFEPPEMPNVPPFGPYEPPKTPTVPPFGPYEPPETPTAPSSAANGVNIVANLMMYFGLLIGYVVISY